MHLSQPGSGTVARGVQRIRWWYGFLVFLAVIFILRAFYLQVIRHNYYQTTAFKSQLKQYEIPATRGTIQAFDGDQIVPVVLNETLFTLFADPTFIKKPDETAKTLAAVTGGNESEYRDLMSNKKTRYVVLAKKLTREQKTAIESKKLKGVGLRDSQYRTYPNGQLASQLLGFVNEDGEGKYGIEEALNTELTGTSGVLKAITDASGVPLPANTDNLVRDPVDGRQLTLTIDIGLQQRVEESLKSRVESTKAVSGSVIVMEAKTGAVKAMANFPTYDPSQYGKVEDAKLFNNDSVGMPLEVGSIMKALTTAAALDKGVVTKNTTYYDPSFFKVDDAIVKNVEEDGGAGTKSVQDILQLSLNTGATWLLMQMGGGEINSKARNTWYDYMVNHYKLGQETGIEQGFEADGRIPAPDKGFGLGITYANTAFGQGMLATPMQMAAAFAAIVNGGTYYQPHLIASERDANGKVFTKEPKVVQSNVVRASVSKDMIDMLSYTFRSNRRVYTDLSFSDAYVVGGKTGTAQISKPSGGYYDDRYNGTYLGFVGGNTPEYIVAVRVSEPHVVGYAGAKAAAPLFAEVADVLINNYSVSPKTSQ